VNDNTLKKGERYSSKRVNTTAQEKRLQEDHEGSSWKNGEKLD
jgi:hypothetical protein